LKALKLRLDLLGEHYHTAASCYKLGLVYRTIDIKTSRYVNICHITTPVTLTPVSRDFFLKAAEVYRKIYISDGPRARALYQLALVHEELGNIKDAEKIGNEAFELLRRLKGEGLRRENVSIQMYDQLVGFMER
jgi:tetratricopeptide (TPR) repeat protein